MAREYKRAADGKFASTNAPKPPAGGTKSSLRSAAKNAATVAAATAGVIALAMLDQKLANDSLARREAFKASAMLRYNEATRNR